MKLKQKSEEVDIESINYMKITSSFQKAFEVHDVKKRIMKKVTWFFWSLKRIAGWKSEKSKKRSDDENETRTDDEMKKIQKKLSEKREEREQKKKFNKWNSNYKKLDYIFK